MPAINVARTDTFEQQRVKINEIGSQIFSIAQGGSDLATGNLKIGDGLLSQPSLAFASDPLLGIYKVNNSKLGFGSASKRVFNLSNLALESYKDLALSLEQTGENNWLDILSTQCMKELKPIIKNLDKVEASLAQIDMGMFGLCADCESEISKEILYRNPSHQRCTSCHQKYIERLSTR